MQALPQRASWVGDLRELANLGIGLFELVRELVPRTTELFFHVLDVLLVAVGKVVRISHRRWSRLHRDVLPVAQLCFVRRLLKPGGELGDLILSFCNLRLRFASSVRCATSVNLLRA